MRNKIEEYLSEQHLNLDKKIYIEIKNLQQNAINASNNDDANFCWCLQTIYEIKEKYLQVFIY